MTAMLYFIVHENVVNHAHHEVHMANALKRVIEPGERVVHESGRIFVCNGTGYGTKPYLSGGAIFGHFEGSNMDDRIEGYEIDVEKTNALKG